MQKLMCLGVAIIILFNSVTNDNILSTLVKYNVIIQTHQIIPDNVKNKISGRNKKERYNGKGR
jgi:hypothetical protein